MEDGLAALGEELEVACSGGEDSCIGLLSRGRERLERLARFFLVLRQQERTTVAVMFSRNHTFQSVGDFRVCVLRCSVWHFFVCSWTEPAFQQFRGSDLDSGTTLLCQFLYAAHSLVMISCDFFVGAGRWWRSAKAEASDSCGVFV